MTEPQSTSTSTSTAETVFIDSFIDALREYHAAGQPHVPDDPLIAHVGAIVRIAYYAQSRRIPGHVEDHASHANGSAAEVT